MIACATSSAAFRVAKQSFAEVRSDAELGIEINGSDAAKAAET